MFLENKKLNKLESNIKKLYFFSFFQHLIFAYVIERLFGLERSITIQQMVYIEIIYAVVVIILEVPTGILADKWSRKKSIILASFFTFFEFFILIYAHNFIFFALSSIVAAIAGALESGATNALIYDSLKLKNKENEFEKVLGRKNLFGNISFGIASLFGSFIASYFGYTMTYWFSLIGVTIAFFISLTLYEPDIRTEIEDSENEDSLKNFNLKDSVNFLKNHIEIKFVMLYIVVLGSVVTYIDEYWQVYFNEIKIPIPFFGFYLVIYSIFVSITVVLAYKLKDKYGYNKLFTFCLIITGLATLSASFIHSKYGFFVLIPIVICYGLAEPLSLGFIHHRTDSFHRATIESFYSLVLRVVTIFVGLIFGYITSNYSIFEGFKFLGVFILIYAIYFLTNKKSLKNN